MEGRAVQGVAFSHMATVAAFSVFALLSISLWQFTHFLTSKTGSVTAVNPGTLIQSEARTPFSSINWQAPAPDAPEAAGDSDGISNIGSNVVAALVGSYATLQENGAYTPMEAERVAGDIATSLRASISYRTYAASDIKTDADTSYDRMLTYRTDLRLALEPLLKNPGYELGIFANYIESGDTRYIAELEAAAKNYHAAAGNAAKVVVPGDAAPAHLGILNALSEFGATLERMAENADDPFATAALLQTYNSVEAHLVASFDSLATYQKNKKI